MFLALAIAAALPQTPAARTASLVDAAFRGQHTELAVLGTAHLSELGDRFTRDRLKPLLARLEAWRPAVITTEDGTGRDCDEAKARPDLFGPEPDAYCRVAFAARAILRLDQPQAEQAVEQALAAPSAPGPSDRRRLAALFLAAGEPGSALVQWLRLAQAEQRSDARLVPELVAALERYATSRNETHSLAAPLAARLGLDRIHPTDDYNGGRHVAKLGKPYVERLTAIWDNPAAKAAAAVRERRTDAFLRGGDVLAYYRWLNAPATLEGQVRADFAAAAADRSQQRTGRLYLAYWETRNLRMVANMRFAFGDRPGVRVLSLVGLSHKPFFERYLATQSDVRVVDVLDLIR